jgi:hypothetical protein
MLTRFQRVSGDAVLREVSDRIAARLVEQDDVLAIGDPPSTEAHPHAPPQRLGVEQSIRQRMCDEEPADSSR